MAKTPEGWLIVLQPENLARMKAGDPVTVPDLRLMICYEELPTSQLVAKLKESSCKYLTRGWANHPDDYKAPERVLQEREPE